MDPAQAGHRRRRWLWAWRTTIIRAGLRPAAGAGRAGAMIEGWSGGLAAYSPAEVERQTGVGAAKLERLARDLVEQRPAVAMVGGAAVAQTSGLFRRSRSTR